MESIDIGQIIKNSTQIYDTWLDNVDTVAHKGFELGRQSLSGEQSDTDPFFSSLKDACNEITTSLKDTPFKGIGRLDPVLQTSIDVFSNDENTVFSVSRTLCRYNFKFMKKSVVAGNEISGAMTKMMSGAAMDETTFDRMTGACMDLYGHTLDFFGIPQSLFFPKTPEPKNSGQESGEQSAEKSVAPPAKKASPLPIKKIKPEVRHHAKIVEPEESHTRKAA